MTVPPPRRPARGSNRPARGSSRPAGGNARPPTAADELLRRCLPEGVLGTTIIGDLHQELEQLVREAAVRRPRLWYWWQAIQLSARYYPIRLKRRFLRRSPAHTHGDDMMTTLLADLRFGLRMLIKTPVLSVIAIATVGLGVGLTSHTFSTVYGSVGRGLPVEGADRMVHLDANRPELGITSMGISIHDYGDLRAQQTSFEDLGAFYAGTVNVAGESGPPERFAGAFVSANALLHLRVEPFLGRTFREGEDLPGASPVIVLGHHVWRNRFGADPAVVGQTIRVNGEAALIVGVMPEGFRFPFLEDVWLPHRIDASGVSRGEGPDLDVFGRLREGVSSEAAQTELSAIAVRLGGEFPESNDGIGFALRPYEERFMPAEITAVLWVMLGSVFGVLLIACANVANLLLARAAVRSKEVAIRTAMGASRGRVIRQLLVESAVLALLGGAVGLALSWWGIGVLGAAIADIYKPYWIDLRMDLPVLVFTFAVTLVASVAAGTVPAVRASGMGVGEILKDETRGSSSFRLGRFSSVLVVAEIAVSCGLLIGAGFMIKSVINLRNLDLGFQSEGVMTGRVGLFETDYPDVESRDRFFNALEERIEAEPGVTSAALTSHLPGLGANLFYVGIDGEAYATDRDYPRSNWSIATSGFFETFGTDLVQGRDFTPDETRIGGEPVVIVNESFVDRYLPGGDVLNRRLRLGASDSESPWMRVVGVVPDMHVGGGVGGIGDDQISPERIFISKGILDFRFLSLAVATQGPPAAMAGRIREIVAGLDPNLPVYDLVPMDVALQQATWAFGLFGSLFTIFGIAALFLAAVGLYGVMAFSVSQRRQEMGIRMALGAQARDIRRLVLGKGMIQLVIGLALGVAIGAGMGLPMRVVLFDVETGDPAVYGAIVLTLAAAGLAACFVPARSATRADPVEAMRAD